MACKGWEGEDFSLRNHVLVSLPQCRHHNHMLIQLNETPPNCSEPGFRSDNTNSRKIIAPSLFLNYCHGKFENSGFNLHTASGNFCGESWQLTQPDVRLGQGTNSPKVVYAGDTRSDLNFNLLLMELAVERRLGQTEGENRVGSASLALHW